MNLLSGDCNICVNRMLPSYSATCTECGLLRKNYKPISNADRIRAMSDEELAYLLVHSPFMIEKNALNWLRQETE